jgi:hypothetical protein
MPLIVGNPALPLVSIQQRMHLRREIHATQEVMWRTVSFLAAQA